MSNEELDLEMHGTSISPGLAEGIVHVHRNLLGPIDVPEDAVQHNVEEEFGRLDAATAKISDDLFALAARVEEDIDSRLAEVFDAHQLIANDSSLKKELRREIVENLVSASSAVKTVFLRWEKRFLLMESQIARDKGDDFRDVSTRLSHALAGIMIHPLDQIPHGRVLATSRLLPSDTIFLSGRSVSAVLLEYGSAGSHAALFAREMGLPCISGLHDLLISVPDGAPAPVDADTGSVTIRPREKQKDLFRKKIDDKEHANHLARMRALSPAVTHAICDSLCTPLSRSRWENRADETQDAPPRPTLDEDSHSQARSPRGRRVARSTGSAGYSEEHDGRKERAAEVQPAASRVEIFRKGTK